MAKKVPAKPAPKAAANGPKAKAAPKATPKAKPPTKNEVFGKLAESTQLTKKQVAAVFEQLEKMIIEELGPKGSQVFQIPNLVKLSVTVRPATAEKMGRNPATGEPMKIAAKPARKAVKVRVLKMLKEAVE
ncbi:histone family protein DNA-binding protein [Isosphaera pallida ATCC 43644]|jgi:nucleoid DNA-binding protein|uniref:Viral histone-like protein n=1 Tax=Isosphaera pallida (strain ATCC 43644 / DSM 9630 / IS1B) TaxID=575540 RepID=E8QX69_ISOPI|nr:HU family DNA-binding protein [Isosphaera pallida]ADV60902.1 histone family protein DNA-binding protein [Isosphaera pallida ATCC 43644]